MSPAPRLTRLDRFCLWGACEGPVCRLRSLYVDYALTSLAVNRRVAASTQNQALGALLFLYREVLDQDLPWLDNLVRDRSTCRCHDPR